MSNHRRNRMHPTVAVLMAILGFLVVLLVIGLVSAFFQALYLFVALLSDLAHGY